MTSQASNNVGWVVGIVGLLAALGMCTQKKSVDIGGAPSAAATTATTLWIANKPANCRSDSRIGASIVKRISAGTPIEQKDARSGWTNVQAGDDTCWVSTTLISTEAPQSRAMGLSSVGTAAVATGVGAAYGSRRYVASRHRSYGSTSRYRAKARSRGRSRRSYVRGSGGYSGSGCPCSGSQVCIGPRGGRFCITSGGNKRYGV